MTRQNPPRDERTLQRHLADTERRLKTMETTPAIIPWEDIPWQNIPWQNIPWQDQTFGAWQNLTLNSGYSAALTGGLGFGHLPQYRFRTNTEIELRGTIQKGTGAGGVGVNGFANGDSPFTLPSGARPAQTAYAAIRCSAGGAANSYGIVGMDLNNAGVFTFRSNIANAPGWLALDQIRFDIA